MKTVNIITQAQVIAGINTFQGNAIDVNQMATSLAIFHQTLNTINNDPKINLIQSVWDYQRDREENPNFPETLSNPSSNAGNGWLDVPQLDNDEPMPEIDVSGLNLKFPNHRTPFGIARAYPLPSDCRRPLKVISGPVELRKTDFSEIKSSQSTPGFTNMFSVNNKEIELVYPGKVKLVYVKEFKEFMPQDEVDLPLESLDYVINLLSYNLALSSNSPRAAMCQTLAEKSYNALLGNLRVNEGEKYLSVHTALSRLSGRGHGTWH